MKDELLISLLQQLCKLLCRIIALLEFIVAEMMKRSKQDGKAVKE